MTYYIYAKRTAAINEGSAVVSGFASSAMGRGRERHFAAAAEMRRSHAPTSFANGGPSMSYANTASKRYSICDQKQRMKRDRGCQKK